MNSYINATHNKENTLTTGGARHNLKTTITQLAHESARDHGAMEEDGMVQWITFSLLYMDGWKCVCHFACKFWARV